LISYLWSLDARSATWVSGLSWLLVIAASAAGNGAIRVVSWHNATRPDSGSGRLAHADRRAV
ncbi:hypothetical protein C5C74_15710, partial [Rathayibacter sp. AY1E8]|uniref:hypothetical protein n=1 Tax=Rathayibacter sp. AY1E8 TaxID=2080555 RepID=UPI000D4504DA